MGYSLDIMQDSIVSAHFASSSDVFDGEHDLRFFFPSAFTRGRFDGNPVVSLGENDAVIVGAKKIPERYKASPEAAVALDYINLYGLCDLSGIDRLMLLDVDACQSEVLTKLHEHFSGRLLFDWTCPSRSEVDSKMFDIRRKDPMLICPTEEQSLIAMRNQLTSTALRLALLVFSLRTSTLSPPEHWCTPEHLAESVFAASGGTYEMPASAFLPFPRSYPFDEELMGKLVRLYPELENIRQQTYVIEAIAELIDYMDENSEFDTLFIPHDELGTTEHSVEEILQFVRQSHMPEMLDAYLAGVPLEDITA